MDCRPAGPRVRTHHVWSALAKLALPTFLRTFPVMLVYCCGIRKYIYMMIPLKILHARVFISYL
jgi:hypothetical protein